MVLVWVSAGIDIKSKIAAVENPDRCIGDSRAGGEGVMYHANRAVWATTITRAFGVWLAADAVGEDDLRTGAGSVALGFASTGSHH
jgi:hypothetical protein